MSACARIAIGTVQPQADLTAIVWALMEVLSRRGLRVQNFLSHAYFCPCDGATTITGMPPRHVDSWLMSEPLCQEVFLRGCRSSDLALVEGSFVSAAEASDFETLCQWLALPRLAVVDARLLVPCQMPPRPDRLDGVLLDRVTDAAELTRLQTLFENTWKVPVVGWLGLLNAPRGEVDALPPGRQPSLSLCQTLGDHLNVSLKTIWHVAESRVWHGPANFPGATAGKLPLRVAIAYDEVFCGYFADSLDLLEQRGATICDFSPLRDERLPPDTDVVYVGCGHPERFAAELSQNDCMMLALKSHYCAGRRIYAECGGLAYLSHEIEMPDGGCWPMVGVLPGTARFDPAPAAPVPTEVKLSSDTWLGCAGQCWRGYLSPRWSLRPTQALDACAAAPGHRWDVVKRNQVVGSRVYLHFAAQETLLDRFFQPGAAAPGGPRPTT